MGGGLKSRGLTDQWHSLSRRYRVVRQLKMPQQFRIIFYLILLATGFVSFSRRQFEHVIHSELLSQAHYVIIDSSGALVSATLLTLVAHWVYLNPIWRRKWYHTIPIYLSVGTIHILLFVRLSTLLREYGYEWMHLTTQPQRDWMSLLSVEASPQIFMLILTGGTVHGLLFFQRSNLEQLMLAKAEQSLVEERLKSLQNQLNPHFLFNTLNLISAVMYDDAAKADRMIEQLSELLRASLKLSQSQEVPLSEEMRLLNGYATLMQERFIDHVEIQIECDPETLHYEVPLLLIQPLLENSFKHWNENSNLSRKITVVKIFKTSFDLIIQVNDQYVQIDQSRASLADLTKEAYSESSGVGHSLTRERLRVLYGDQGYLTSETKPDGYLTEVRINLNMLEFERG